MKFLDHDFVRMRYPVHKVPNDKDILEEIPEITPEETLKKTQLPFWFAETGSNR